MGFSVEKVILKLGINPDISDDYNLNLLLDMILTLTINPALDLYTRVEKVYPGEKLRCEKAKLDPGGGGVNVSRVIHRLGGETTAIYSRGGYTGEIFKDLLEQEGVKQDTVEIAEAIRQNIAVTETSSGELYRFGFPGPSLSETEFQDVLTRLNLYKMADFWVASGSLPPGVPDDFYAQVAEKAAENNVKLVLDTSGKAFSKILEKGAYLLKPNKNELEDLVGIKADDEQKQKELLLQVLEKYPVEVIVLSLGSQGALLATKGKVRHFPAPEVVHVSSIGAGDSMVAGMVYSLSRGDELEKAILYGLACGSATIKSPGTELLKKEDVEPLFQKLLNKVQMNDLL
ncbi:6-phosphofructokinase 2 [Salinimicrobium catena]|uniref:6-phosphofructokinase 2 n=1 Tax=Salinimicrobium catena TaxID=390640 RepID=A0A1H5N0H1_9FLAO|nr:1-phosphofructokinase family hexose kinase [Salinimicrobium catena]SDL33621.1 6-phosphofructokinase 2 [Salinimicrobium catena]SEE94940.1 6-phosphofructokinase 2 [Salinimicrobium catena]